MFILFPSASLRRFHAEHHARDALSFLHLYRRCLACGDREQATVALYLAKTYLRCAKSAGYQAQGAA